MPAAHQGSAPNFVVFWQNTLCYFHFTRDITIFSEKTNRIRVVVVHVIIYSWKHDFKNGLSISIRYQIFRKVKIHIVVFQVIPLCCSMAGKYHLFGDICCIHLQDKPLDIVIHTPISFKHLAFIPGAVDFRSRPNSGPWDPM